MTTETLQDLEPETQGKMVQLMIAMQQAGHPVRPVPPITRTMDQQAELWAQGRTKPSTVGCLHDGETARRPVGSCTEHPLGATVTRAQPGYSWHNFGRACDFIFVTPDGLGTWQGPYALLGQKAKELGMEWGGDFPNGQGDEDHVEYHPNLTLAQARQTAETGEVQTT